jgi:hypothetical protein
VAASIRGSRSSNPSHEASIIRDVDSMKDFIRVGVVVLVVVATVLVVGAVAVTVWSSRHPVAASCPTGSDKRAATCRDAEASCREDPRSSFSGVGDGDRLSYGWSCDHGVMTSFNYSEAT